MKILTLIFPLVLISLTACSPRKQDASEHTAETSGAMMKPSSVDNVTDAKLKEPNPKMDNSLATANPVIASNSYSLSVNEIISLKKIAIDGDNTAAAKLAGYYSYIENNIKEATHWWRLAARDNNEVAKYNLAFFLCQYGRDDKEKLEGLELMKKCAAEGNRVAEGYLKSHAIR